jgi:SPP1 family predicted phage head-tail adaptor
MADSLRPGQTLATVWASIVPATARDLERVVAGTVQSSATHLVTIRYLAGVTTKTRVVFGSRLFSVTGVQNPEERNISLVLVCQESVT